MAQNITIAGASYANVPSITIPKTGGGNASFVDTSDANAAAGNVLSGKTAYVNGSKITGTISSKAAQTYTPTTSNQTISAGQYLSGAQTVKGDANLVAGNIKKGVTIFGITGTHEGGGGTFTVALNAPKNSTVSWTGQASGSASMGSQTQASVSLAAGTYTFTNKLTIDGTQTTIFTKTVAISANTTVNLYPAGAVYWYGMVLLSGFSFNANRGTVTVNDNSVYAYYNRSNTSSLSVMLQGTAAYNTSGKSTMRVRFASGASSGTYAYSRFYAATSLVDENPTGVASSNYFTQSYTEIGIPLGSYAGQSLYFESVWGRQSTWSSGYKYAEHTIYAIWFE